MPIRSAHALAGARSNLDLFLWPSHLELPYSMPHALFHSQLLSPAAAAAALLIPTRPNTQPTGSSDGSSNNDQLGLTGLAWWTIARTAEFAGGAAYIFLPNFGKGEDGKGDAGGEPTGASPSSSVDDTAGPSPVGGASAVGNGAPAPLVDGGKIDCSGGEEGEEEASSGTVRT